MTLPVLPSDAPRPGADEPSWDPPPLGYTVEERIAVSGMAEVWRARGRQGQPVLLKRPRPDRAGERTLIDLFDHECRLGRLVSHPHLVRVLDAGGGVDELGGAFLALRPVSGVTVSSLRARARARGGLDASAVLRVAADVFEALDYLHHLRGPGDEPLGCVHRDVCPPNILVDEHGQAILGDFGIACSRLSNVQAPKAGRLRYMPPEQVRGGPVDHRADLYAVGLWCWELLTGRDAWGDSSESYVVAELEAGRGPRRLADRRSLHQPPAIAELLARLADPLPANRPTSAGEVLATLVWAAPALWEWEARARVAALLPQADRGDEVGEPVTQVTGLPLPTLIPTGFGPLDPAFARWLSDFDILAAWYGQGHTWDAVGPTAGATPSPWADLVRQVLSGPGRTGLGEGAVPQGGVVQYRERLLLWRSEGGATFAVLSPHRASARGLWAAVLGYLRERRMTNAPVESRAVELSL